VNTLPPEYLRAKEQAEKSLKESDAIQAFSHIRPFLNYPARIENETHWYDIFTLFKNIVSPVLGESVEQSIDAIIDDPENVDGLYDLAYALYEEGLYGVAAMLLRKALDIDPSNIRVITELSANLEVLMFHNDAYKMLVEARVFFGDDSMCLYLLGYNAIMVGNVEAAKSILPILEKDPDDTIQFMFAMLRGMVNRALALKKTRALDERDLRGWHLAINGSILLHLSPYGFDDGMLGRYAYISDNYPLIKDGILRIGKILEHSDIQVEAIITLPDRGSRALGIAASKILEIPMIAWNEFDETTQGLIIVYDLHDIDDPDIISRLQNHNPNQILWCHATCWTTTFPFAADITTYLYQNKVAPWEEQLAYIEDQVQMSPADKSDESELADKIIEAEIDESFFDDAEDIISLLNALKTINEPDRPGIFQSSGKRFKLREGSPVQSSRFLW